MNKLFYCADEAQGVWFNLQDVKKITIQSYTGNNGDRYFLDFTLEDGIEYSTGPWWSEFEEAVEYVNSLLSSNGLIAK